MQVLGGRPALRTFYYIFISFFLILYDQVAWRYQVYTIVLLIQFHIAR